MKIEYSLRKLAWAPIALWTIAFLVQPAQAATTYDVSVGPGGALVFLPDTLTIDVGDSVLWTLDSHAHNVSSGLPGFPTSAFLSGPPALAGTTFEVLFDQAFLDANPVAGNVYNFYCQPHGDFDMVGSVTVVPEPVTLSLLAVGGLALLRRRR